MHGCEFPFTKKYFKRNFSSRNFGGRAGGTHQFRVELLGRPPPVHGHQGLRGCGDAVAVEVKLALSVGVSARARLGAGGGEAAGPGKHLPMQRGQGVGRVWAAAPQRPRQRTTATAWFLRRFSLCEERGGRQQASILFWWGLDRCVGHRLQSFSLQNGSPRHSSNKLVGHLSL